MIELRSNRKLDNRLNFCLQHNGRCSLKTWVAKNHVKNIFPVCFFYFMIKIGGATDFSEWVGLLSGSS